MGIDEYLELHQRIEVTVWTHDQDEEGTTFKSYIKEISGNRILIDPPSVAEFRHLEGYMTHGLVVGVCAYSKKYPILFYPYIDEYQTQGLIGFWLYVSKETQMEIVQRRRHVRVPMSLPVQVTVPDRVEDENVIEPEHTLEGMSLNISGGGILFASMAFFESDQILHLRFEFHVAAEQATMARQPQKGIASPVLELSARVVHSRENPEAKTRKERYLTAVQFVNLTDEQEALLIQECFKREMALKRAR